MARSRTAAYDDARDQARARAAFTALLQKTKPAVEARMSAIFAARRKRRAPHGTEVAHVVDVAEDVSMRGGKRFRAALLASSYLGQVGLAAGPARAGRQATAKAKGASNGKVSFAVAVAGGVALEMLQSYLLIQDDWMDGDVERRGGPSAHVALAQKLGVGQPRSKSRGGNGKSHPTSGAGLPPEQAGAVGALLASDLVWGLAVSALLEAKADPEVVVRAVKELMHIHEDVVAGQVLDTVAREADVEVLHDLKTGSYTVRGPLALGAILGGAPATTLKALVRYADPLGVGFQLRDDLLGIFGTIEEAGRPRGSDLLAGKNTSVMRHASPLLRGAGKRAVDAVWKLRDATPRDVGVAVDAIEATGAREEVEKRLATLCSRAEREASKLPLAPRARDELAGASLAIRVGPGGREAR